MIAARSEGQAGAELESARPAGAESLGRADVRLTESRCGQVAAVAAEVGDVEYVEPLGHDRDLGPFPNPEHARQPEVGRKESVAVRESVRKRDPRDDLVGRRA